MASPELAAKVTLMPLERIGVDALIIFNDILTPLAHMGLDLTFTEKGPQFPQPITRKEQIDRLHAPDPLVCAQNLGDTIRAVRSEVGDDVPILGFTGAPFTLASYLIEGGTSRYFHKTKELMVQEPRHFQKILDVLSETVNRYLKFQIDCGADMVQVFDTWVGCMGEDDYRRFVFEPTRRAIQGLGDTPVLLFARSSSALLEAMVDIGPSGLAIDWTVSPERARQLVAGKMCLQGNLDPVWLFADRDTVIEKTRQVLDRFGSEPGHIFNLGHGILPETPVENARAVVETVKQYGQG